MRLSKLTIIIIGFSLSLPSAYSDVFVDQSRDGGAKKASLAIHGGATSFAYRQDFKSNYSGSFLSAKTVLRLPFSKVFDINATAGGLAHSISNNQNLNIQILDTSVRLGLTLTSPRSPWRLALLAGAYYTTMLVPGQGFGYQNISGPQLFPVIQRMFRRHALLLYGRYSPVVQNLRLLSTKNYEVAGGLGWAAPVASKRHIIFSVDYSLIKLEIDRSSARAQKLGLSIGITL